VKVTFRKASRHDEQDAQQDRGPDVCPSRTSPVARRGREVAHPRRLPPYPDAAMKERRRGKRLIPALLAIAGCVAGGPHRRRARSAHPHGPGQDPVDALWCAGTMSVESLGLPGRVGARCERVGLCGPATQPAIASSAGSSLAPSPLLHRGNQGRAGRRPRVRHLPSPLGASRMKFGTGRHPARSCERPARRALAPF